MQLLRSHKLLIERFLLEPNRVLSTNSINHAIDNINSHQPDEPKLYISKLLEYGIVDVVDNNQYRLSSSAIIEVNNQLISINVPITLIEKYVIKELVYKSIFLLDIKFKTKIQNILKLPIVRIKPLTLLRALPNLKTIVEAFKNKEVYELGGYNYFNMSNKWSNFESKDLLGCYRAGNEAFYNKLIRVSKNDWYQVPDINHHPDAFLIAAKYADILNLRPIGLEYSSQLKELTCTNYLFPSLVKRIINLNACFDDDNIIIGSNNNTYKNVEHSFYKTLNPIFMNKINLI